MKNYINGFCESDQMSSIISSETTAATKNYKKPLTSTRIVCRFYYGEMPYWNNFVRYHKSLGAHDFLVFVQNKEDKRWIEKNTNPRDINIRIHHDSQTAEAHHDMVLRKANPELFRENYQNKFQILLDIDEYFVQHRLDVTPEKVIDIHSPNVHQIFLPSILSLRLNDERTFSNLKGIWGHVGRPIAETKFIDKIKDAHSFKTSHEKSLPAGMFGLSIIHLWTRSFEDCLIKIFSRTKKDIKSPGREASLASLNEDELPHRLRLLAFLSLQDFYLDLNSRTNVQPEFNGETEYLEQFLSTRNQLKCRLLFEEYRLRLKPILNKLPTYPAANFPSIRKKLPSLKELRAN